MGGVSLLERSSLSLPSILYAIADNQKHICQEYLKRGLGFLIERNGDNECSKLKAAIQKFADHEVLAEKSEANGQFVDAKGANRVAKILLKKFGFFSACEASKADVGFIYDCRYSMVNHSFYVSQTMPSYESHKTWFFDALNDKKVRHIIYKIGNVKCGYIRTDVKDGYSDVSIYLHQSHRGKGLAEPMLKDISKVLSSEKLIATVHSENLPSLRTLRKLALKLCLTMMFF